VVSERSWTGYTHYLRICQTFYCLTVLWISPVNTFGDGFMTERVPLGQAARLVASPRQEALLICEGDRIQVTLRTSFRAGPQKLAWVIPVPHPPESVEQASDAIFTNLDDATLPSFEIQTVTRRGIFGCGGAARVEQQQIGQIAVTKSGQAGIYDYTILRAGDASELRERMNEHC
jgi:hypothetical protein